jgi:hypothetical protein
VTIPISVTSIGEKAFAEAGLTEVTISNPNAVIADGAFDETVTVIIDKPEPVVVTKTPPSITQQPTGATVIAGDSIRFEVTASGTRPLAYQWEKSGVNLDGALIAGATTSTLELQNVSAADAGTYTVVLSNEAGAVESAAATLAVHYTLSTATTGSGTVSVSPEAASYAPGTRVTLNAKPPEGYMFGSWSGDASGKSNPLTVVMSGSKTIRANFAETSPTVNRVYVNGNLVEEGQSVEVRDEATVELATAFGAGKIFYTIDGGRSEAYSKPFMLTESGSLVVTSYSSDFSEVSLSEPVQINILPSWTVSITSTGGGTARLLQEGASFIQGTLVTTKAEAEAGWEFIGWEGDFEITDVSFTFTVAKAMNLKAVFGTRVNLNAVPPGSGTVQLQPESALYANGRNYTVQAAPSKGYYFRSWSLDDSQLSPVEYTVEEANLTLTALFLPLAEGDVSLTPLVKGDGFVKVGASQNVFAEGAKVTLEAVARPGAFFTGWSGQATGTEIKITVTLDESKVITANFGSGYTIEVSSTNGEVTLEPDQPTYPEGTQVTLTAEPADNFAFAGWSGDLGGIGNPLNVTMTKDLNVEALFGGAFSIDSQIASGRGQIKTVPDQNRFLAGTSIGLEALPGAGFKFVKWDYQGLQLDEPIIPPFQITENISVSAFFQDVQKPNVTILEPIGGVTGNENINLRGLLTDNGTLDSVTWLRGEENQGVLELAEDKFDLKGIVLLKGDNSYSVMARDTEGNVSTETVNVTWNPIRTIELVDAPEKQEGKRINIPVRLSSNGDVGGMTFILNYDHQVLRDPILVWSSAAGTSINSVNTDVPGEVKATFSLVGSGLPEGDQLIATVSFRVRSVPGSMYTDYNLEVLDMSMTDGNQVNYGTHVDPGTARLLKRKYNGDSNGNDRLDIGDGTLVQRLLTGFDEKRSWDSGGNDLNGNGKLDSGDVILLLRTVVGLDKQPSSGNRDIAKMNPRPVIRMGGPDDEPVEMASLRLVEKKGGRIKVQVVSENLESAMSGIAFTLHYPVEKLRLKDQKAHSVGEIVPDDAVKIWNVFPGQNDYVKQSGRVRLALSNVEQWELANGVLAEFELEVEGGADLVEAELSLSEVELTPTGYDNRMLPDVVLGLGEDAKPPVIVQVSGKLPFKFGFKSQKGRGYVVEVTDDLRKWNLVETIQGNGSMMHFTDRREALFERQYYRVKVE